MSLSDLPEQLGTCQGEQVGEGQPEEAGRLPHLRVLRQVNCVGQERRDIRPPFTEASLELSYLS